MKKVKNYTLTIQSTENGHEQLSKMDGFTPLEVIGLLYLEMENIRREMLAVKSSEFRENAPFEFSESGPDATEAQP